MNEYLTNEQIKILKQGYDGKEVDLHNKPLAGAYTDLARRKLIDLTYGSSDVNMGIYLVTEKGKAAIDQMKREQKRSKVDHKTAIEIAIISALISSAAMLIENFISYEFFR